MNAHAQADLESQVLDLANQAIARQVEGEHRQARRHWAAAIALAETGLVDEEIDCWLRTGLAEACFRLGDDPACIQAARRACASAARAQAALAMLLLGQALFRSGRHAAALDLLAQARSLLGAAFAAALEPGLRAAILACLRTDRAA